MEAGIKSDDNTHNEVKAPPPIQSMSSRNVFTETFQHFTLNAALAIFVCLVIQEFILEVFFMCRVYKRYGLTAFCRAYQSPNRTGIRQVFTMRLVLLIQMLLLCTTTTMETLRALDIKEAFQHAALTLFAFMVLKGAIAQFVAMHKVYKCRGFIAATCYYHIAGRRTIAMRLTLLIQLLILSTAFHVK